MKISYQEPKKVKIIPIPIKTKGGEAPVLLLDGTWMLKTGDNYCETEVPYDITFYPDDNMQQEERLLYVKTVRLTEAFHHQDCILRFEGVNGFTKVWVNGSYAGEHQNAFLTWNLNITKFLAGDTVTISVLVEEKADRVSTFNHGGILRSVKLLAVPKTYVSLLHVGTDLNEDGTTATMQIQYAIEGTEWEKCKAHFYLEDPSGDLVHDGDLWLESFPREAISHTGEILKSIDNPYLWDAEHPHLYTLHMDLYQKKPDGIIRIEQVAQTFGFRKITIVGNQMFINGKEVKLRGVCRHEISPYAGRYVTNEMIEEDVRLFKEANCNYIRTSHYPPNEHLLEVCDREGMYVEDEMALAFIARTLPYTQREAAQTGRYLSHFSELYARDFSHPSVIIWSLCNESFGGLNFDLLNRYVHKTDPSRPTKFSYPMTMAKEHEKIDIWSVHYPNVDSDLAKKADNVSVGFAPGYDMPVLHDEYAHIPCYNRTEHRRDPGVRNFWGKSIKQFWDNIWNTKGALGGAIWAGIDETNIYKGGNTCLEWGIIDVFRRKKPEFYHTRKAYSPVVIKEENMIIGKTGEIQIPIENRFSHTNLKEVSITWACGENSGSFTGPEIGPGEQGMLVLDNICSKEFNKSLFLTFYDACGKSIDEYDLTINKNHEDQTIMEGVSAGIPPKLIETREAFTVQGRGFSIIFSKDTGLITQGKSNHSIVLISGPSLHVPYMNLEPWCMKAITAKQSDPVTRVSIKGSYGTQMDITFELTISADGRIKTEYCLDHLFTNLPKAMKLRVGVDCGGLDELGVTYLLSPETDTFCWSGKGLWSTYPEDHIGRNTGTCSRSNGGGDPVFGEVPRIPFAKDSKSYILNGRYDTPFKGTNDFRSLKENIRYAKAFCNETKSGLEAYSDGIHSIRMEVMENPETILRADNSAVEYYGTWYLTEEDQPGSGTEMCSRTKGDYLLCKFKGTGIVWYGPSDIPCGHAKVYLDGELMDACIDQRVNGVDFPGSAAGTDKKYHLPLYYTEGLEDKEHELKIEVTGEKSQDAADTYIIIECFQIIPAIFRQPVAMHILNDYNYPHIAWGNYCRDKIEIWEGYRNEVYTRLN